MPKFSYWSRVVEIVEMDFSNSLLQATLKLLKS